MQKSNSGTMDARPGKVVERKILPYLVLMNDQKLIYLNTAATGIVSKESVEAAENFQKATLSDPGNTFVQWIKEGLPGLRKKTATLLGAHEDQIAFVPNFSFGLLPVVQSLRPYLKKVLLHDEDYPSVNLPFELGGFEVSYIKSPDGFHLPLSLFKEVIEREKIEIVAISHVQFLTGFKADINALGNYCKEKGIVFIVDGTQSIGAFSCNFSKLPVDVLISSSYKWLNGGFGSAVLCIKEDFIQRFPPVIAGFGSMKHVTDEWNYVPSVKSFEPGHLNAPGLLQLEKAIDRKLKEGMANIEAHDQKLITRLQEGFGELPLKVRGGLETTERMAILCFEADEKMYDCLTQKGFALTWRKGLIRVSPHFYNTEEETDALLETLKHLQ